MRQTKVIQDQEKPIATEVLAASIKAISDGVRRMKAGPLNDRAIELLVQNAATPLPMGRRVSLVEVRAVITGMESLEKAFLKQKTKK